MSITVLALSENEFCHSIESALGKGKEHASVIYKEWIRKGSIPFGHPIFKNGQKLLIDIVALTDFSWPPLARVYKQEETLKFWTAVDDLLIESVIIPMKFGFTLCVSSQVGCRMGCSFCQTGRMGLKKNLEPSLITGQLFVAKHLLGYDIRNIVFMGMGEPFDNFDHVKQAVVCLTCPRGFNLGPRHITISTSGRLDGIERMKHEMNPALNLAVSINAPNEKVRTKLMPITRKYSMDALHKAMKEFGRPILAEYVLIKDLTDQPEHADELAGYLKEIPVKINLIPYNPQDPDPYERPSPDAVEAFKKRLQSHGLKTLLRTTKGKDIMAACGQLGPPKIKKSV